MTAPGTAVGRTGRGRDQTAPGPDAAKPSGRPRCPAPASTSVFPRVPSRPAGKRSASAPSHAPGSQCAFPGGCPLLPPVRSLSPPYVLQKEGKKKVTPATQFPTSGFPLGGRRVVPDGAGLSRDSWLWPRSAREKKTEQPANRTPKYPAARPEQKKGEKERKKASTKKYINKN